MKNMDSVCGAKCDQCGYGKSEGCPGCGQSGACPFGKPCFIARYIQIGGMSAYEEFVKTLLAEINALKMPGMPKFERLTPVNGALVNLEYPFPDGRTERFLDDREVYLAAQAPATFEEGNENCFFGVVANANFLMVSMYNPDGSDPELLAFKKR